MPICSTSSGTGSCSAQLVIPLVSGAVDVTKSTACIRLEPTILGACVHVSASTARQHLHVYTAHARRATHADTLRLGFGCRVSVYGVLELDAPLLRSPTAPAMLVFLATPSLLRS